MIAETGSTHGNISGEKIKEGNKVKRTGNLLSVNVSEELLGRVVNPLGEPQDGKSKIKKN